MEYLTESLSAAGVFATTNFAQSVEFSAQPPRELRMTSGGAYKPTHPSFASMHSSMRRSAPLPKSKRFRGATRAPAASDSFTATLDLVDGGANLLRRPGCDYCSCDPGFRGPPPRYLCAINGAKSCDAIDMG